VQGLEYYATNFQVIGSNLAHVYDCGVFPLGRGIIPWPFVPGVTSAETKQFKLTQPLSYYGRKIILVLINVEIYLLKHLYNSRFNRLIQKKCVALVTRCSLGLETAMAPTVNRG